MQTRFLSLLLLICLVHISSATHFRGGSITWTSYPNGTVSFYFISYWNISFVQTAFTVRFSNGVSLSINAVKVASNSDYTTVASTFLRHQLARGVFTVYITDCCRISTLKSGKDETWTLYTKVTVGTELMTSSSSSLPPIVPFGIGLNLLQVVAQKPGVWSLTPTSLSSLSQPAFFGRATSLIAINPSNGVLNWTTTFNDVGLWAIQITHTSVEGYIVIDFIIKVNPISVTQDPPVVSFDPPTTSYPLLVGNSLSFKVGCSTISPVAVSLTTPTLHKDDMRLGGVFGQSSVDLNTTGNGVASFSPFSWASAVITSGSTTQDFVIPFTCTNKLNGLSDTKFILISVASPLTISCPPAAEVSCLGAPSPVQPTVKSGCTGSPTLSFTDSPAGTSNCGGQFTRTWTVTNDCLQNATCTQSLTAKDKVAPTLTGVTSSSSVQCFAASSVSSFASPFATDNCDPKPSLTFSDVSTKKESSCNNQITRTFQSSDACGNSVSAPQVINVNDNTPPVITPNAKTNYACPRDVDLSAGVSDNCDGVSSIRSSVIPTQCGPNAFTTLSYSASDSCGNTASSTFVVKVNHQNLPTYTTASVTLSCPTQVTSVPAPTVTGFCGERITPVLVSTAPQLVGKAVVQMVRTWTATDSCSNTLTIVENIPVKDSTAPEISPLSAFSGECGSKTDVSFLGTPSAIDSCDESVDISHSDVTSGSGCDLTIARTWTATDSYGNKASLVQSINLRDNMAPTYVPPSNYIGQCAADSDPSVSGKPVLSDCNTGSATSTDSTSASAKPDCGDRTISRTWVISDNCGNSESFEQVITISDTTKPNLVVPPNTKVDCVSKATVENTGKASATDNCGGSLTPTFTDDTSDPAKIVRTWTVSDSCGNTATGEQEIVLDNALPLLTVPSNINVDCPDATDPNITGKATASDNCKGNLVPSYTDKSSGSCPTVITRTWSVTDSETGQTASADQIITVGHKNGPTISAPSDRTVECVAESGVDHTGVATVTALCGEPVSVSPQDQSSPGSITRTWSSTDSCGITTTATQIITIKDTTSPVISVPGSAKITCPSDIDPIKYGVATATDNCDKDSDISITKSDASVAAPSTGSSNTDSPCNSIRRTWTATDKSGNEATEVQMLNYVPSDPTFSQADQSIHVDCFDEVAGIPLVSATDACGNEANVTKVEVSNPVGCGFAVTRTYTAVDSCGNVATFEQSINVHDTKIPTISRPLTVELECEKDVSEDGVVTAADNCPGVGTPTYFDFSRDEGCPTVIERRWSVLDACGLGSNYEIQSIILRKKTPPTLYTPPSQEIRCTDSTDADVSGTGVATAFDVCGSPLTPTFEDSYGAKPDGTIIVNRVWTVKDDCGNEATDKQVITILPDIPTYTMPDAFTGVCGQSIDPDTTGKPTYAVKCGGIEVNYYDPSSCPISGTFRRKWTLSRGGVVVASDYQSITLTDCPLTASLGIGNLSTELGPRPYSIYPVIQLFDDDIPCESITLIWVWGDGSNSTQICDLASPCSGCNFNGKSLEASYAHTYSYPGLYSVQLIAYDARATLPAHIDKPAVGTPVSGDGWISLTFEYITVYDPSSGSISGTATYFSRESYAALDELAGNAFFAFGARFAQSASSVTASGETTLIIGSEYTFESTSYDTISLAPPTSTLGARAFWSGQGKVNGQTGFSFTVYALDSGNDDDDRIRFQLRNSTDHVIYDTDAGSFALDVVPAEIPSSLVTVSIQDPPPTSVSALTSDSSTAANPATIPVAVIIIIVVLAVLLAIVSITCVVLFLRLRAASMISQ